jgi:hypothetical protein
MLNSPEIRTRLAAGQALTELADERAMNEFERLLAANPTRDVAWTVGGWRRALSEKLSKQ